MQEELITCNDTENYIDVISLLISLSYFNLNLFEFKISALFQFIFFKSLVTFLEEDNMEM